MVDIKLNTEDLLRLLFVRMDGKCYTIAAEQMAVEVAERVFNLQFPDFSEITEMADKLRWLRYQKGLRQRDVADYAGIDRSTYVHYEEYSKDLYPLEHMERIAQLFEVPVESLLDDYNLFL